MQRMTLQPDAGPATLFERPPTTISDVVRACNVYSTVPYLGVLFVPFTIGFGIYCYVDGSRKLRADQCRSALFGVGLSLIILSVQIFLWWLLYIIPEIGI